MDIGRPKLLIFTQRATHNTDCEPTSKQKGERNLLCGSKSIKLPNNFQEWSCKINRDSAQSNTDGWLGYRDEFCGLFIWVHMGNCSLVDRDEIQRDTTKMVEHKLVSFTTIVALWTVTLQIMVIHKLLKWKHIQGDNYAFLAAMLRKQSYFQFV